MKQKRTKLLSWLLVAVMAISVFPMTAFSESSYMYYGTTQYADKITFELVGQYAADSYDPYCLSHVATKYSNGETDLLEGEDGPAQAKFLRLYQGSNTLEYPGEQVTGDLLDLPGSWYIAEYAIVPNYDYLPEDDIRFNEGVSVSVDGQEAYIVSYDERMLIIRINVVPTRQVSSVVNIDILEPKVGDTYLDYTEDDSWDYDLNYERIFYAHGCEYSVTRLYKGGTVEKPGRLIYAPYDYEEDTVYIAEIGMRRSEHNGSRLAEDFTVMINGLEASRFIKKIERDYLTVGPIFVNDWEYMYQVAFTTEAVRNQPLSVEIVEPVAGQKQSNTIVSKGGDYSVSVTWRDPLMNQPVPVNDYFRPDYTYEARVSFTLDESETPIYGLPRDVSVNGKKPEYVNHYPEGDGRITYEYKLTYPLEYLGTIDVANASFFTQLVPGNGLPTQLESDTPDRFNAKILKWYKGGTVDAPGEEVSRITCQANTTYILEAKLTPQPGYGLPATAASKIGGSVGKYISGAADGSSTYRYAYTMESGFIPEVTITGWIEEGGEIVDGFNTATPKNEKKKAATISITDSVRCNGGLVKFGDKVTCGHYTATAYLRPVRNDYYFTKETVVYYNGKTYTGDDIDVWYNGALLFIEDFVDFTNDHRYGGIGYDAGNHWRQCDVCGMQYDVTPHEWYLYSTKGGQTEYHCSCGATRIIKGVEVWQYEVTDVPPVVGYPISDIKPRNTYQADKALVTSTTWYVGSVSPANKLSAGATFEAGKKYYAVMTIEAQNGCFFDGVLAVYGDSSMFKVTYADKATMTSTTATATFEYDILTNQTLSLVLPEVSAGKTIRDILDDTVVQFDGADGDCGFVVKQVGDDPYSHSVRRAASGAYAKYDSSSADEILDIVILPGKTYVISVMPDLMGSVTTYIFENDIMVTNDYGANYTVHGNDMLWEIDATYQTGSNKIGQITLSDIVAPQIGEMPSNNYSLNTQSVTKGAMSWNTSSAFEPDTPYTATITLTAKEGFSFTENVTVIAKCNNASVTKSLSGSTLTVTINFSALVRCVAVSGQVSSYDPQNITTIQLRQGAVVKYTTTIPAETGSGQMTQQFSFPSVAPGIYDLLVTKSGHQPCTVTGITVGSEALDLTTMMDTITLQKAAVIGSGVSVSGQVRSYNPQTAATIKLMQGMAVKYSTTIAATDGNGQVTQQFSFPSVAPGTYNLVVTKPGHLPYTVTGITVDSTALDLSTMTGKAYQTITLLCGDVNGDDVINSTDLNIIWKLENYLKTLSNCQYPY